VLHAFKLLCATCALLLFAVTASAQRAAQSRADGELLARAVLSIARDMLRTQGEFAPFGAGMAPNHEVIDVAPPDEAGQRHAGGAVGALRESLAKALASGQLTSTALVYEAKLSLPPSMERRDAIAVALNHRNGYAALWVYPYQVVEDQIRIGEPQVIEQKTVSTKPKGKPRK
jgi:hypothetical protein